jgi:adenine phosphoribosyltransferase
MKEELNRLIESFKGIPVVEREDYHYFIHPLSDGIPLITPEMLEDAVSCIISLLPPSDNYGMLITAEAMGIPLTTMLSHELEKPFSIARKRRYGIPGEIIVKQTTGYSTSSIHLNLPVRGGRAVIVDDVLSTGGTLRSIAKGMKGSRWDIECAVILFNKMGDRKNDLENEMGIPIFTLLDVDRVDGAFVARRSD